MPKNYLIEGRENTFYRVGEVAKLIGKSVDTLKRWEKQGILPETPYRFHTYRLYSIPQVKSIIEWHEKTMIRSGVYVKTIKPIVFR